MARLDVSRGRAVLLASFVLLSAVAGSGLVGTVAAEDFSKTVDGSPKYVVMDVSDISGEYTIEVSTTDAPGTSGEKVLFRDTMNAANKDGSVAFGNFGAYETVTFTVKGVSSEPTIGTGSDFGAQTWGKNSGRFAHTGGDRGFVCDPLEWTAKMVDPAVHNIDCHALPGTTQVENATDLDANETELEIYESAQTQAQGAENWHTAIDNRLQNTDTVALVNHARPAYIESLNTAGSKSAANTTAVSNITEYYSVIERNVYAEWNGQIEHVEYLNSLAESTTGVDSGFVGVDHDDSLTEAGEMNVTIESFGTRTITLQNDSQIDVRTITIKQFVNPESQDTWFTNTVTIGPTDGKTELIMDPNNPDPGPGYINNITGIGVTAPAGDYPDTRMVDFEEYAGSLSEIDSQNSGTINQMANIVNQTYDEYQTGEINKSDLLTPATLMGNYSPGSDFDSYAAATLANLGISQPENYSTLGTMNVSFGDGTEAQGIVMAANNPPGGQWQTGVEYNPANISGGEFLVGGSSIREIDQNFTITSMTNTSGGNVTTFTIEERNYSTTNVEGMKELYNSIESLRADINARQSAFAGGGGINWGGLGGNQKLALLVVVAVVAYGAVRD